MDRSHKLIVINDIMHRVVEDKEMELLFTQGTNHKCVSVILITQRETCQDHSFKYVVLGIDEEFERRFPSRYTWSTAIPGPCKRVHKSLRRRSRFQTGLLNSGYESSQGRPILFEE